jgi:hypothetical protein
MYFNMGVTTFFDNYRNLFDTLHNEWNCTYKHARVFGEFMLFDIENVESRRQICSLLFGPEHRENTTDDDSELFLRTGME